MLSEFNIAKVLRDHLATMPSVPSIATEGVDYKPTANVPFIAEYALGGAQQTPTLGDDSSYIRGVYQLTVNTPKGSGKWGMLTLVDSVMSHFNKGLVVTRSGVKVTVTNVTRTPIMQEVAWQQVHVSVYYTAL